MEEKQSEQLNGTKVKPGRALKRWAHRTWVHKITGAEITIESDRPQRCKELFLMSIGDPKEWREKR